MLTEDGKHLYVSYDEYHNLIEKLAIKIHQSGWQFDTILCLARGGLRPGDILSRIFDSHWPSCPPVPIVLGQERCRVIWTLHTTLPRPKARLRAKYC